MLVFFSGSIGDSLIALPFFRKFREIFSSEPIYLLHDEMMPGCRELLEPTGCIDGFISYPPVRGWCGRIKQILWMKKTLHSLHERNLIYLLRSQPRMERRILRDTCFFRLCGIRHFYGIRSVFRFPRRTSGEPFPEIPHHIDLLARRFLADEIVFSKAELARFDLDFHPEEIAHVKCWQEQMLRRVGDRTPIAVGIGGNKSVCLWPLERYVSVLKELIARDNVFPVLFGGERDREKITLVLRQLPVGGHADEFGALSLRESVLAMGHCRWYLGNDTGSLHMAVAAGLKCVAIFSAHNFRGLWYPYGAGHRILRSEIGCECCGHHDCPRGTPPPCLLKVSGQDVLAACRTMTAE